MSRTAYTTLHNKAKYIVKRTMKVWTSTVVIALLCLWAEKGHAAEICYDDLGCFSDEGCHRNEFPPESPAFINTRFYLYTRRNWNDAQELKRDDLAGLRASNFDPKVPTKFSIHGWNSNGFTSGERDRKNAFLENANVNVITVDWRRGASGIVYPKQHQNTRVVGREVALLARFLNLNKGMYYKDVHIVGHSLGAHTGGYAGAYQPGFGRITGSDPAGPFFRKDEPECRLDPTDALFVDVIHGDGNDNIGLGTSLPMGHQDFYPNGGRRQPACDFGSDIAGCSHAYSSRYFAESLRSTTCQFKAYPCPSWTAYMSGLCRTCGAQGCSEMGYHAIDHKELEGLFFLDTNPESPYCIPEP